MAEISVLPAEWRHHAVRHTLLVREAHCPAVCKTNSKIQPSPVQKFAGPYVLVNVVNNEITQEKTRNDTLKVDGEAREQQQNL